MVSAKIPIGLCVIVSVFESSHEIVSNAIDSTVLSHSYIHLAVMGCAPAPASDTPSHQKAWSGRLNSLMGEHCMKHNFDGIESTYEWLIVESGK